LWQCGLGLNSASSPHSEASHLTSLRPSYVRVGPQASDIEAPLEGKRKTVTALFADIKGSTELMEELDPDEAVPLIAPLLELPIGTKYQPLSTAPDQHRKRLLASGSPMQLHVKLLCYERGIRLPAT
jgi:hypothetical protein